METSAAKKKRYKVVLDFLKCCWYGPVLYEKTEKNGMPQLQVLYRPPDKSPEAAKLRGIFVLPQMDVNPVLP